MDFVSSLDHMIRESRFSHYGWTRMGKPLSMDIYRAWLADGQHASMTYLHQHADLKENPQLFAPRARSALVVARSYAEHPYPECEFPNGLRTALYARGEDYHVRLKRELEELAEQMRAFYPSEEFLCFTDSAPILERDLAYRAGLGWFGKNTCLIHPEHGSLFFIGQIFTSLELSDDGAAAIPVPDHCGTCSRCIDACPTGALGPRRLNANKCISFWTIEAREAAPPEIRARAGDWYFGCDICQTVCPWNEKVFGRESISSRPVPDISLLEDLRWVLRSSHREILRKCKNSPLRRARPLGLKRNALIVIANRQITVLRAEVEMALANPRLRELAQWTLNRL